MNENNNANNNNNNITNSDRESNIFPQPFTRKNRNLMRLVKRVEEQPEIRRWEAPPIQQFFHRFPVYREYEFNSFKQAYDAVKRYFKRSKF